MTATSKPQFQHTPNWVAPLKLIRSAKLTLFLQILILLACIRATPTSGLLYALAAIALAFSGRFRMRLLALFNVAFIIFTEYGFRTRDAGRSAWVAAPMDLSLAGQMAVKAAALGMTFAIFVLLWKIHRKTRFRYLLSMNFVTLLFLVGVYLCTRSGNFASTILWFTVCITARYFWMFTFSHLAFRERPRVRVTEWAAALPFWQALSNWHIGSVPRGFGELEKCQVTSNEDAALGRKSATKLFLLASLFFFVGWIANDVITDAAGMESITTSSLTQALTSDLHGSQIWLRDLLSGLMAVTRNIWITGVMVGLAQFGGFRIAPAVGRVWSARSFTEFLRRYYYYYSETISYFFLPTCWKIFGRLPLPTRVQNVGVVFFSLLIGGTVTHFIEDIPFGLDADFSFFYAFLKKMPYIFALAVFAAISSVFHISGRKERVRVIPMIYYFAVYILARVLLAWSLDDYFINFTPATVIDYWTYLANHFRF